MAAATIGPTGSSSNVFVLDDLIRLRSGAASMRVAILGAGGVALGTAALLASKGHEPIVWSPSGKSTQALSTGLPLVVQGAIDGTFPIAVAVSCGEAVRDSQVVI